MQKLWQLRHIDGNPFEFFDRPHRPEAARPGIGQQNKLI